MLSVMCVKVGTAFGPHEVNFLYAMVQRHLHYPHRFVCVTDDPVGIHPGVVTFAPERECWGWWNLQEAYRPPRWSDGPIMYFGLDTIIRDDITHLLDGRDKLTLMRDLNHLVGHVSLFKDTYADGYTWIPEEGVPILWERFEKHIRKDSRYPMHVWNTDIIREEGIPIDLWDDVCPGSHCSYKWPSPSEEEPKEPIVLFHGKPRPREVTHLEWVGRHYHDRDV